VADSEALRALPSVHELLEQLDPAVVAGFPRPVVVSEVRRVLDAARQRILAGGEGAPSGLDRQVAQALAALAAPSLRRVINATGVVIHTNLGRAPLGRFDPLPGYSNLEYDLASGKRGRRDTHTGALLERLLEAPAIVVNNNAAAVLLALHELARGGEVIVSRGELIEIGGAFRMPDIMKAAGCKLVEVGTTNRTHARDFAAAIGPRTALVLKAHTSNYAVTGFTAAVPEQELAALAHAKNIPLVVDLGSGALVDLSRYGLPKEPLPREMLAAGADIVMFSGDKLLGGPQAGLIVGRADLVARIKKDPLKRALRVSKLTLAALEATLRIYASAFRLPERLPTLALLARDVEDIRAACGRMRAAFAQFAGADFEARIENCASQIGSGAQPVERLASCAVVLAPRAPKAAGRKIEALMQRLRALPRPVIGRVQENAVWMDLRCLRDESALQMQLLQERQEEGS